MDTAGYNEELYYDSVMRNIKEGVRITWKDEDHLTSSQDEDERLSQLEGVLLAYPPRVHSVHHPQQHAYQKKWRELWTRRKLLGKHREHQMLSKIKADKGRDKEHKRKAKKKREKRKKDEQEILVLPD